MRTVALLLVVASTLACKPVSSEISVPTESTTTQTPPETAKPQVETEFDVVRALDGVEKVLAVIDANSGNGSEIGEDGYSMESYLDDQGLRSLYFYGRSKLSLVVLGELFGVPVYVSGPHGRDPDFAGSDFGHYDLRFVERVVVAAIALGQDRPRVERTRAAFDRRLRQQAITYLLVYQAVHRDPKWFAEFERDYVTALESPDQAWEFRGNITPMNEAFEAKGFSWYEADTAAHFWVRRELDGSAETWVRALEALFAAYGVEVPAEPPGLPEGVQ